MEKESEYTQKDLLFLGEFSGLNREGGCDMIKVTKQVNITNKGRNYSE